MAFLITDFYGPILTAVIEMNACKKDLGRNKRRNCRIFHELAIAVRETMRSDPCTEEPPYKTRLHSAYFYLGNLLIY